MVRTQQASVFKNKSSIFLLSSFYLRSFFYPQLEQMLHGFPTVCYPGLSTGPAELSKERIRSRWSLSLIIPPHIPLRPKGSGSVQDCPSPLPLAEKLGRTPSKSSRNRTCAFFLLELTGYGRLSPRTSNSWIPTWNLKWYRRWSNGGPI